MKTYFLIITTLLVVVVAGLLGCSDDNTSVTKQPGPVDSASRPDTEIRGATIDLYHGSELTTKVHAKRIVRFDDIDSTVGYTIDMIFYDSAGTETSNLVADSGVIREISGAFDVYGHVVVTTSDSVRLDTDYLKWNPSINRITTDAFVRISRPGDTETGWGLEATRDLSRIKILHQVSGTVHNVEDLK